MSDIFVDILTSDDRFGRMLCLELERFGVKVILGDHRPSLPTKVEKRFVVADLDCCSEKTLEEIDSGCTLIGFSRRREAEITLLVRACNVFLHRPFHTSELLNIIVGEKVNYGEHSTAQKNSLDVHGSKNNVLRVNSERRCAVWGNQEIALSDNEYRVLEILCKRRGELVGRKELDNLLGIDGGNMSDVYICHLRRKLDNRLGLKLICTIRSKGYILNN